MDKAWPRQLATGYIIAKVVATGDNCLQLTTTCCRENVANMSLYNLSEKKRVIACCVHKHMEVTLRNKAHRLDGKKATVCTLSNGGGWVKVHCNGEIINWRNGWWEQPIKVCG